MKKVFLALIFLTSLNACFEEADTESYSAGTVSSSPIQVTHEPIDKPFKIEEPYPSQMPMHLVYPRPDNETQKHARHRWAHPEMKYRIPIGIQGGSWPFKYELITSPEGSSIGNIKGERSYGIIEWQPTTQGGVAHFHVKVTDQEDNTLDIFWSVNIATDRFVFIQDGWNGEKKGTISAPLEDVVDWYKNSRSDNTFHNKIVVFRKGNYELKGSKETNGNLRLDSSSKTPSLIGFPGEKAYIDASKAKVITDVGQLQDMFIANLNWHNSRQDVKNAHFFWAIGDVSRATWWNNSFHHHGPGIIGNDNPAGVFISGKGSKKQHILYKGNRHQHFYDGRLNGSLIDIYYSSYVLIEDNLASNIDVYCGFLAKGTTGYVTIRNNHAFENIEGGGICVGYGKESPEISNNHEVAWNRIVLASPKTNSPSLLWAIQNTWGGETYNSFIYRNTFVNGSAWIRFPGINKYQVDSNVVVTNNLRRWELSNMTTTRDNVVSSIDDLIIVENDGSIKKVFKEEYFGKVGFEVGN